MIKIKQDVFGKFIVVSEVDNIEVAYFKCDKREEANVQAAWLRKQRGGEK